MPTPADTTLLRMDGWPGGVNNRIRETEQSVERDSRTVPSSKFLRKALNVDLTQEGHPIRRKGYTLHTAGYAHSVYGCEQLGVFCVVVDGQLLAGPDPDSLNLVAEVNRYNRMSYCFLNDTIYYSNGIQLGEINAYNYTARPWGIPVGPTPTLTGPATQNPEGWEETRQVAVVYVDRYGLEGGASEPVLVGAVGDFTVSIPLPLLAEVSEARVYVSQPNSEILYYAQAIIAAPTITIHPTDIGKGKELETLNLKPPMAGQLVASFKGRVYIARNDKIIFTEALQYHLTRPSQGIFMFPGYITLLQPSTDGIYVGTEHGIVFLAGTDPYETKQIHVSAIAPVENAVTRTTEMFGVGASVDEIPIWWDKAGTLNAGFPGGQINDLTGDRLEVAAYQAGAIGVRDYEGMTHIVSSLRSADGMNPVGASDTVVATVRTNNIVLNS